MIRRPPRSTLDRSSAASDVYKRQAQQLGAGEHAAARVVRVAEQHDPRALVGPRGETPVSYTHLRAHETVLDLVCRLLLEKQKNIMCRPLIRIHVHTPLVHTSQTH